MIARALIVGCFALSALSVTAVAQDDPPAPEAETSLPANASALDRKVRLDRLLNRLATAPTPEDAKPYEASIDVLWNQSGSDTADLLTTRAVDLVAAEDQQGALKLLDAALEARPDFAEGWNKRATLFFLSGDYVSAMSAIHETLRYEPRHYGAWAGLGKILEQSGDDEKALAAYRRALAIHPHLEGLRKNADELEIKLKGEEL